MCAFEIQCKLVVLTWYMSKQQTVPLSRHVCGLMCIRGCQLTNSWLFGVPFVLALCAHLAPNLHLRFKRNKLHLGLIVPETLSFLKHKQDLQRTIHGCMLDLITCTFVAHTCAILSYHQQVQQCLLFMYIRSVRLTYCFHCCCIALSMWHGTFVTFCCDFSSSFFRTTSGMR